MNIKYAYHSLKKHKKAYCIIAKTQSYIEKSEDLIYLLNLYSKYPVILYYSEGEVNFDYENLITQPFDTINDRFEFEKQEINNKYNTLTKAINLHNCITNYDLNSLIMLDTDFLITPSIDDIFQYECVIENYPLFIKYPWDLMYINGHPMYNEHVNKLLNNPTRSMYDVCSCMCILNKNCKQFLQYWKQLCSQKELIDFYFNENPHLYFQYNDEHVANMLLWKYKATKQLPSNITHCYSSKVVDFVFSQYKKEVIDLKYHMCLQNTHYDIPSEIIKSNDGFSVLPVSKKNLWGFHGIKDKEEISKSKNLITTNYYEQ